MIIIPLTIRQEKANFRKRVKRSAMFGSIIQIQIVL